MPLWALCSARSRPDVTRGTLATRRLMIQYTILLFSSSRQKKYSSPDGRRFSRLYQAQFFSLHPRKTASHETKKAESSMTLPPCKPMLIIFNGPKIRSSQKSCQGRDDAAIRRSADFFISFPIASSGGPYLFSTRMKYTWLLKTCSGTSSFAQFIIDC